MNALLLSGGRVIDPANSFNALADVLLCEGRVAALGAEAAARAPVDAERLDVSGLVVCPGLIDMHVHLREPGQAAKETIASACARRMMDSMSSAADWMKQALHWGYSYGVGARSVRPVRGL